MSRPATEPGVVMTRWQLGPWNRWTYQHVGELLPTRRVGHGTVIDWRDGGTAGLGEVRFDRGDGTETTVDDYAAGSFADAVVVARDEALLFERYANGMDGGTRHLSQSVAKSVLSLVVGCLHGRGLIDVDAPVTEYVPELSASGYAGATIAHLLDMTAAVDFDEDYTGDFWRYDVACGWHPPVMGAPERTVLDFLSTIGPAEWTHGERMRYVSPNTDLLGIVAERAGGLPLAEVIARELWIPMGARDEAELTVDPADTAVISGGLCATARDYARIGALVAAGGQVAGRQVVPADWIRSLGRGDPAAFARGSHGHDRPRWTGYARKWWCNDRLIAARGIHGQLIAVDRESRVVVVILSSWPDALDPVEEAGQLALVQAVVTSIAD